MTMALQPEGSSVKPSPKPSIPQRPGNAVPTQVVSASPLGVTNNSASPKPPRKRVTSSPSAVSQSESSSSSALGRQQCAGITKAGKRCSRQVKLGAYLAPVQTEMPNGEWEPEVFCFQHVKELMGPSGFYSRKDGTWIEFADYIPSYLHPDTQVALRVEMEKARSPSDVPGYIYAFEIRDPDAKDTVKLKVGRAVNLVKRIDQWEKQCGSKEQVLRGYYPGPTSKPDGDGRDDSLMKGRLKAGDIGPWCHRMDLSASSMYLVPNWPNVSPQIGSPSPSTSMKRSVSNSAAPEPCPDCGSLHKEIFEFKQFKGRLKGQEWESVVQPVIQKWGGFVAQYV
ncbi:hypothetical protein H0H92_006538 [Tricholoma furcatifolium]|nr:hypothetical protein H0H92_006538 [Tricholoma furcatifolium]